MHSLKRKPRHMSAERSLLCRGVVYYMSANFFRIFTEQGTADPGRLIFSGWHSWAHPQRDMGRLHRFLPGCEQFLPQLFQVHFAAQPCTESLDDFGRIIFAAVEAAINALLGRWRNSWKRVAMATLLPSLITPRKSACRTMAKPTYTAVRVSVP